MDGKFLIALSTQQRIKYQLSINTEEILKHLFPLK